MPKEIIGKHTGEPEETDAMKAARLFMEGWAEMDAASSIQAYGLEEPYVSSGLFDARIAVYNSGRRTRRQTTETEQPESTAPEPVIHDVE